jgi:hypothetical protein
MKENTLYFILLAIIMSGKHIGLFVLHVGENTSLYHGKNKQIKKQNKKDPFLVRKYEMK